MNRLRLYSNKWQLNFALAHSSSLGTGYFFHPFEQSIKNTLFPQNHGKVLELLNQLLSSVASAPPTPESQRCRLQQLAVTIADRYKGCGHSASQSLAHTFFLLLDIMTFFDHYHSKRSDQALEVGRCGCERGREGGRCVHVSMHMPLWSSM